MFDRLKWPLTLSGALAAPLVAGVNTSSSLLEPVRHQCRRCGAHAFAIGGGGRCGNCGCRDLGPLE